MPIPPENVAMVGSDCPGADGNCGGLSCVGTDHSHGRRKVRSALPSVRVPAKKLCDSSPLAGAA
jgi:hypothetical protein